MGERIRRQRTLASTVGKVLVQTPLSEERMNVKTRGGLMQVCWDKRGQATAMGQLVFFAEFLEVAGLFERWVQECPLNYTSPNAPGTSDVLGSWMLSILDGQRRYAHVAGLRGDGLAPGVLGMESIVGDDSLRRALSQIAPAPQDRHNEEQRAAQQAQVARAEQWMQSQLMHSVQGVLERPWILDCDTTVKPLYGRQRGAEVGYNPRKPGRASHTVHTYWIGNLRLVLHAQLQSGKAHAALHSLPGLKKLLQRLTPAQRPHMVRGDCAFGTDAVICEMEALNQPYLFKLRQSTGVKKLLQRQWRQRWWTDVGQGWQACEDHLQLMGWQQQRRVTVLRRAQRLDLVVETDGKRGQNQRQSSLQFIEKGTPDKAWEYAVLVSNVDYPIETIGQLYRDRADCENGFDELKNQWGWGGYTTQDIERCNLCAQAVGLIYNWWSWYVRLAHPNARLEAITSRPLLLAAVGRVSQHAGQKRVVLSMTHAASTQIKTLIANVRAGLQRIRESAPQLQPAQRWQALVRYIVDKIIAAVPRNIWRYPALETG